MSLEIILVGVGIATFLLSVPKFYRAYSLSREVKNRRRWSFLMIMVFGFLAGYLGFFSHLMEAEELTQSDFLVSLIFFGGGIFVFTCSTLFLSTAQDLIEASVKEIEQSETIGEQSRALSRSVDRDVYEKSQEKARIAEEVAEASEIERERLEVRMVADQRLEGIALMASGIAHDFNNLLVGILGNASYAGKLGPDQASDFRDALEDVEMAAERAAILTQQLSAYCGQGSARLEKVDLAGMIREMLGLMRSSMNSKVKVNIEVPEDLPKIWGDSARFRQLIMNLFQNGFEAMLPGGGNLFVGASLQTQPEPGRGQPTLDDELEPGDYICLTFRDEGAGIEATDMERVFEPFFSTKGVGRGLGLAAVHGVVFSHGGSLSLESAVGKGTTVRVFLPKAPLEAEEAVSDARVELSRACAGRILVVDDELIVLDVARRGLELAGYAVDTASNKAELDELVTRSESDYSVAIVDIMMPDIIFGEMFQSLRSRFPGLGILISSGHSDVDLRKTIKNLDHIGFLTKPYRVDSLVKAVEAMGVVPEGVLDSLD